MRVFVAMSFDEKYKSRYADVIVPSIENRPINGKTLSAHRVDISRSGESILSEIADGIAHSYLVLADVSTCDIGRFNQQPVRNANVMYEVGIALACRQPEEVLLVRDDNDKIMFDTSTIPHLTIDFEDKDGAIDIIYNSLCDRAKERDLKRDARVKIAMTRITTNELQLVRDLAVASPGEAIDLRKDVGNGIKILPIATAASLSNLLREEIATASMILDDGGLAYSLTDIGRAVNDKLSNLQEKIKYK
jgi:hypothetical protein